MTVVTKDKLEELFTYDRDQGKIFWKNDRSGKIKSGREAGCRVHSGIVVRFNNKLHRLSRIIWCFETGVYPDTIVRHKDGDKYNCKFDNLFLHKKKTSRNFVKDIETDWLRENFTYNRETGQLKSKGRDRKITLTSEGYEGIYLLGRYRMVHRLIWQIVTGNPPVNKIDHINGVKNDNRWINLREANSHQNGCNRLIGKDNKSGFKNVYFNKAIGKFRAHIMKLGEQKHLGYFSTAQEAHKAYIEAAKEMHGEFYNDGFGSEGCSS